MAETAKYSFFPQIVFHLSTEREYANAGFIQCSSSRAVLYHVQEILVYVRTSGFAGLRLKYIHFLAFSAILGLMYSVKIMQ